MKDHIHPNGDPHTTIDNPFDTPAAYSFRPAPKQCELTTPADTVPRVRLMYAVLTALGHKPMLTESPGQAVVRVICTQAQWDEAMHHLDWIGMQCNLRIEVSS